MLLPSHQDDPLAMLTHRRSFSIQTVQPRRYYMAKQIDVEQDPVFTLQRPTGMQAKNIFTNANQDDFEKRLSLNQFPIDQIKEYQILGSTDGFTSGALLQKRKDLQLTKSLSHNKMKNLFHGQLGHSSHFPLTEAVQAIQKQSKRDTRRDTTLNANDLLELQAQNQRQEVKLLSQKERKQLVEQQRLEQLKKEQKEERLEKSMTMNIGIMKSKSNGRPIKQVKTIGKTEMDNQLEQSLRRLEVNRQQSKEEFMNKTYQEKMLESRQERVMKKIQKRGYDWEVLSKNLAGLVGKQDTVFSQHFEQESHYDYVHNNFQSHIDTWHNNLRNYGPQKLHIPKIVTRREVVVDRKMMLTGMSQVQKEKQMVDNASDRYILGELTKDKDESPLCFQDHQPIHASTLSGFRC